MGQKFPFQYRITIYLDRVEGRSRCEEESRREIDGRIIQVGTRNIRETRMNLGRIIGNINLLKARKKGGITHDVNAKVDIRRNSDMKGFHVECSDSMCM